MPSSGIEDQDSYPSSDKLIPLREAAEICGLTQDHLRRLIREKKLWGQKIGWSWVTTEAVIREYVARDRRPGPKPKK